MELGTHWLKKQGHIYCLIASSEADQVTGEIRYVFLPVCDEEEEAKLLVLTEKEAKRDLIPLDEKNFPRKKKVQIKALE